MKASLMLLTVLFISFTVFAQTEFNGIVKYKMSVAGADEKYADSMQVIFDKSRLMISLYMPDQEKPGGNYLLRIIEDFAANREYAVDEATKSYKSDSIPPASLIRFVDTKRTGQVKNISCSYYQADSATIDTALVKKSECMVSLTHFKSNIKEFIFMNMQPLVLNNRLVIDFLATDPDGTQPRIYVADMIEKSNVAEYFDLSGYTEIK